MTVTDFEVLYDYCHWANRKLFAVISRLTPEQFTSPVVENYGSIRNTMVHVISAEAGWLERCGGPKRGPRLNPAEFSDAQSVIELCNGVEANMRGFLPTLNDQDLLRDAEYTIDGTQTFSMPMGELLQHAANHGVHHRGQVALLLRLLGYAPGNLDILFYYAEKHGIPAF